MERRADTTGSVLRPTVACALPADGGTWPAPSGAPVVWVAYSHLRRAYPSNVSRGSAVV